MTLGFKLEPLPRTGCFKFTVPSKRIYDRTAHQGRQNVKKYGTCSAPRVKHSTAVQFYAVKTAKYCGRLFVALSCLTFKTPAKISVEVLRTVNPHHALCREFNVSSYGSNFTRLYQLASISSKAILHR
jgi:hypothetical protein